MNEQIAYHVNRATEAEITQHLRECDAAFTPPLSQRLDLQQYGQKILNHAVRFEAWSGNTLAGLVAAYCNDPDNRTAYITSVSVLQKWQGRGIARRLLRQCIEHARRSAMRQVSLEVARNDAAAIGLYEKAGFVSGDARDISMMMHLSLQPSPSVDSEARGDR
jgi:ribosomal protein S18 acetylase RimI-like enzyme